jgi:hypothetical protein
LQDPVDVVFLISRRYYGDGIPLGGEMAATGGGEHAPHPRAHGEAHDCQGGTRVGTEGIKHLFKAIGDIKFIDDGAWPDHRHAGGTGRHRQHVAVGQYPAAAAICQRVGTHVVLFSH